MRLRVGQPALDAIGTMTRSTCLPKKGITNKALNIDARKFETDAQAFASYEFTILCPRSKLKE